MALLKSPIFGICFSLILYTIGQDLFKKSKGFFLLQPLFFAMVAGIIVLVLLAKGLELMLKPYILKLINPAEI